MRQGAQARYLHLMTAKWLPGAGSVVSLLLLAAPAAAQQLEPRSIPSRNVESYSYRSPTMGNRYDISVGAPGGFRPAPGKKYPALVVTDRNLTFPNALDAIRSLEGIIEDLFVISVGTPFEEGDSSHVRRRVYEFSPPGWAMADPFGKEVTKACQQFHSEAGRCVGGASRFLAFIATEVLPAVMAKYPIDRERLGLFGLSAGGFFASYAIFQPNSPFTTYIISSPAMAYGDGEVFRQEERYPGANKDLKVGIYLGSGSLEADDPFLEGIGRIVSGQVHFAAMLRSRKYPSLKLFSEIHPGLGHSDAAGSTLIRGLRLLYAK